MDDHELQTQTQKQQSQTLQLPLAAAGRRDMARIAILLAAAAVLCLMSSYHSSLPFQSLQVLNFSAIGPPDTHEGRELERILRDASTENKTVIITTLNKAWAEPNSMFDLFLESFRVGQGTHHLLRHVVVVCLDATAFSRCSEVHDRRRCYFLRTTGTDFSGEKLFMSQDYLRMMWRRIDFLASVLQLGYNFLFTDADIVWLRDPFTRLDANADFQIASDFFNGDSNSVRNAVNGGFTFVRANNRTIEFYKFWYSSRQMFPGKHDQDVFNKIKLGPYIEKIGIKMRFLDTVYFGGFCQPSRDMNRVCTMHANCCIGQANKVKDLRQVLEDWRVYLSGHRREMRWRSPENCRRSMKK
ncbi:PREDICTED: uncharacterized protein At4g15970-like [Tarenaya hassleriana]|uniref:uncharacterized protein At4g15970-like n=1 Tax=Tarenaya hassleriana TaxID=28532 RepID=UPI00053C693A|nr:PREDICTED: uncharacterized protein At4g15970-like [Tarenaya hassleriana]